MGNFDGVHLGHQALIAEARRQAEATQGAAGGAGVRAASGGILPAASRFHPAHALAHQGAAVGRAGRGRDVRAHLRRQHGQAQRADDFVRKCWSEALALSGVVVGPDFEFGKGRAGNVATL